MGLGGVANNSSSKLQTIHKYNVEGNSWESIGEMELARSNCMVAVMEDRMIVVGGEELSTSVTEIAMINTIVL